MHVIVVYFKDEIETMKPRGHLTQPFIAYVGDEEAAERYGRTWVDAHPDDIVMLVSLETGTCKNCNKPIHENLGWVVHKWVHKWGNYYCFKSVTHRAEPKENT